jgi:beta-N-acetylhexosaminidase
VSRILATKLRAFRAGTGDGSAPAPGLTDIRLSVPAPGAREFFAQVSARAVTLIAGARIPFRPLAREKILLCGQFPDFLSEGLKRWPGAQALLFPFNPFYSARAEDRAAVRARAAAFDTIIFCVANYNSLEILKELKRLGRRVIVVSALSPVYLAETTWVQTAIAVYGDGKDSFRAGFGVLAGDIPAAGVLPVSFPPQGQQ